MSDLSDFGLVIEMPSQRILDLKDYLTSFPGEILPWRPVHRELINLFDSWDGITYEDSLKILELSSVSLRGIEVTKYKSHVFVKVM